MRNKIVYITAILIGVSACSGNQDITTDDSSLFSLCVSMANTYVNSRETRSSASATDVLNFTTTLTTGDQIGIYGIRHGEIIYDNIPYQVEDATGKCSPVDINHALSRSGGMTYVAYYPYRANLTMSNNFPNNDATNAALMGKVKDLFTIDNDQSTQDKLLAQDLMMGYDVNADDGLTFNLEHQLALIAVEIYSDPASLLSPAKPSTYTIGGNTACAINDIYYAITQLDTSDKATLNFEFSNSGLPTSTINQSVSGADGKLTSYRMQVNGHYVVSLSSLVNATEAAHVRRTVETH
jgi:hypothetical protein